MVWYSALFRFTALPVSLLAVLLYAVVFISVLVNDCTPGTLRSVDGLDLEKAFRDLQTITNHPHPYSSRANDDVRLFLLERVQSLVSGCDYIHVADDTVNSALYVDGRSGKYFEGTNIIVRVEGTQPSATSNGVLFSAHYDSVSTGYGATDDGMGTVTLLQLIEYFSIPERRPRRTAVFLLNNGEEDGLNGSHLFYEHPWSNLTSIFVNLEGGGAGGRPLVFRSTSLGPIRAFTSTDIHYPSANVLGADAFARGVIRSRTDFQVFAKGVEGRTKGMEGVDFAFYKNRALYHTLLDSISGIGSGESKKALWTMIDTARGAGVALLNKVESDSLEDGGVYFDLLGRSLLAFPRRYLLFMDIIVLIIAPLSVIFLVFRVSSLSQLLTTDGPPVQEHEMWVNAKKMLITVFGCGRFWLSLIIGVLANVGLVVGYLKLNPFVIHSYPTAVVASTLAVSYLGLVVPFALFQKFLPSPPSSQKLATVLGLYVLSYIFLIIGTVLVDRLELGGTYWITGWHICVWVATLVALGEGAERAKAGEGEGGNDDLNPVGGFLPEEQDISGRRFVRGIRYERREETEIDNQAVDADAPIETEPTEITPLMHQHRRRSQGGHEYVIGIDGTSTRVDDGKGAHVSYQERGWWIVQMLTLIPLPAMLEFQLLVLLVHALAHTMADGSSPLIVYAAVSALSFLIMLNLTPFAHRMHRGLTWTVLIVFLATVTFSWTAFPFTQNAPLRVFFLQRLELKLPSLFSPHGSVVHTETLLTGPHGFIDSQVIPLLPSSFGHNVSCVVDDKLRVGLRTCQWDSSGLLPSPGGTVSSRVAPKGLIASSTATRASDWMKATFTRNTGNNATITVRGVNTRACHIEFDSPISAYNVRGSSGRMQAGYDVSAEGVIELALWSRDWDREFVVDFQWEGSHDTMEGRVSCDWVEYASGAAGSEWSSQSGQIPAFEEALKFLPLWTAPTKWTVGLVEARAKFAV